VRFIRSRKRDERQGLLAEPKAPEKPGSRIANWTPA